MKKDRKQKKRSTSASKTPTHGGMIRMDGDKRKVKLIPDSVVSLSKDAPSIILQSTKDLTASLSGGRLQRLEESTHASVRAPKYNNDGLQREKLDFQTKYAEVKGLKTTEIDNMIKGLAGDQDTVTYLVTF